MAERDSDREAAEARSKYWTTVGHPFGQIVRDMITRVERDIGDELQARAYGARMFVLTNLRVALSVFEVIEHLSMERKRVGLGFRPAVAIPPLSRSILDSTFSFLYVFDDPETRVTRYWKAVWGSIVDEIKLIESDRGNDPEAQPRLAFLRDQRDGWERDFRTWGMSLTPEELADEREVRWPGLRVMKRDMQDVWRLHAIKWLDAHYYGVLSHAAHAKAIGGVIQGVQVMPGTIVENLRGYYTQQFTIGFAMMLALACVATLDAMRERTFARRIAEFCARDIGGGAREVYDRCFKIQIDTLAS